MITQLDEKVTRAYGVSLVSVYLLEYLSSVFKSDHKFFQRKNKYLLKQLIDNNTHLLRNAESIRKLQNPDLDLDVLEQAGVDSDILSEDLEEQFKMVIDFVKIFVKLPAYKVYDLGLNMSEILDGNRLYTQNDVKQILRTAMYDISKFEPTDQYIQKYIS